MGKKRRKRKADGRLWIWVNAMIALIIFVTAWIWFDGAYGMLTEIGEKLSAPPEAQAQAAPAAADPEAGSTDPEPDGTDAEAESAGPESDGTDAETGDGTEGIEETFLPPEYRRYCEEIGERYGILPELLEAMIERESRGVADIVSSGGDSGVLQVNPKWHKDRMERLGVSDLSDPYQCILTGADLLSELLEKEGDVYLALMLYNMKQDRARELYGQGIISEYAKSVTKRAWDLEILHEWRKQCE